MWRKIWQLTVMALIVGGLGCPDPLLISKKPVEGKPTSYEPAAVTWHEPKPPAEPTRNDVVQQPYTGRPVPVGYLPADDNGVSIGKPR